MREFDGVKIGIFGLLLPETLKTSRTEGAVEIRDPCETAARDHSENSRSRGAGNRCPHASLDGEDKQLARCSGVDVIIGGHEHTLLESMAGRTPIFKMTADARELGQIDLNISQIDRQARKHRLENPPGERKR